jgi:hypothetical protein
MATITPKELAAKLGVDAKTTRKFLRSTEGLDMKVGKGNRWAIESTAVKGLKSRFAKWNAARLEEIARGRVARAEAARNAADAPEADADEVELEETDEG